ncbi:MAG TPA: hypothetical protein VM925_29800, partial [Labilithrix sp.]|nr:hypothetical protein [Labilithrix sp.]
TDELMLGDDRIAGTDDRNAAGAGVPVVGPSAAVVAEHQLVGAAAVAGVPVVGPSDAVVAEHRFVLPVGSGDPLVTEHRFVAVVPVLGSGDASVAEHRFGSAVLALALPLALHPEVGPR